MYVTVRPGWFDASVYVLPVQVKSKWDPEGVFSKPFTVQPAKA